MKTILVIISLVVLELTPSAEDKSNSSEPSKELTGVLVIIDPGHGGKDSGAFAKPKGGKTLYEAPYVYDISCRLRDCLVSKGAVVKMTTFDLKTGVKPSNDSFLAHNKNSVFNDEGREVIIAHEVGLAHRLTIAKAATKNTDMMTLILSIHLDSTKSVVSGPTVYAPELPGSDGLAASIALAFHANGRDRKGNSTMLVRSGDKDHGIPNYFVLRGDQNPIANRTLVELGNLKNAGDLWRIRDWKTRQSDADILTKGIVAFVASQKK